MQESIIKARFDKVIDMINASTNAGQVHPEEAKLRYALPLQNGKGQYIFNVKDCPSTDNIRYFQLDRNDVFIPNKWGVRIALKNNTTGVVTSYTFAPVNDGVSPSIYAAGFTTEQINALWSGHMQWLVDNVVYLSSYPLEKFHKVPETQGLFVLSSENAAVQEGIQLERSLDKELELIYPKFVMAGTRDHKISVNFDAAGLTFPVTSGYTPYLELFMDGFLIKGGCEYVDGKNAFKDAVGQW